MLKRNLTHLLEEMMAKAMRKVYGDTLPLHFYPPEISLCVHEQFGHYQCNSVLKLAKELSLPPREIAKKLVEAFDPFTQGIKVVDTLSIAGAGFINFILDKDFLSSQLNWALCDPLLGVEKNFKKKKIIVEFSSPNVAKELHVGHLRSTIIGDALANLFEFLGHEVVRLNHIGDWGTQFGMLIAYMKKHASDVLEGKKHVDPSTLTDWYRKAKLLFDEDEKFRSESHREVVKLQQEEKVSIAYWQVICNLSREAFEKIYDLLDIRITERGESFYNPYLKWIVDELDKKKMITVSDGAKCIFLPGFKNREGEDLPIIIQKSDGGYNYDTTDMAAMWHRANVEKADRIIVVTDAGQCLHFEMIYAAAVKAKFLDPKKTEFNHVPFGLVLGPDGKKFKTRAGETEKLIDLIYEAIDRAKKIMSERNADLSEKELEACSRILGIDALKYADLCNHRIKDYVFSYDKMLKLEGNTAAFLLYSYVRILGIKRKVFGSEDKKIEDKISLEHPAEISLGLHMKRFGEVLESIERDLLPHRLCDYLYELAEKFNIFFRDCRVEGAKEEKQRLALLELCLKIFEKGFTILGLKSLSRM